MGRGLTATHFRDDPGHVELAVDRGDAADSAEAADRPVPAGRAAGTAGRERT